MDERINKVWNHISVRSEEHKRRGNWNSKFVTLVHVYILYVYILFSLRKGII